MDILRADKGETLIEVIVAVVILGVIAMSSMNAFSVARKTNQLSNKTSQSEELAITMLEEANNINYDRLTDEDYRNTNYLQLDSGYCKLKVPSTFTTTEDWTIDTNASGETVLTLDNIKGGSADYKVILTLNNLAYQSNYNTTEFPNVSTITEESTAIIDGVGGTNTYTKDASEEMEAAYTVKNTTNLKYFKTDNMCSTSDEEALQEFLQRNMSWVLHKYNLACNEIDEYNDIHGTDLEYPLAPGEEGSIYEYMTEDELKKYLKKTTTITLKNNSLFTYLTVNMTYSLNQWKGGTFVDIIESTDALPNPKREYTISVVRTQKYLTLSDLYFMYTPLSSDWLEGNTNDIVDNIVVDNQITHADGSGAKVTTLNFYIIQQPFDSEGEELDANGFIEVGATKIPKYDLGAKQKVTIIKQDGNKATMPIYTNLNLKPSNVDGYSTSFITSLNTDIVHANNDAYSRLFEVKVEVRDAKTNALYVTKESSVLK